jgi:serine/threonine-protein kinase
VVHLTVAATPGKVTVPDVSGQNQATAGGNIRAAGLTVGSTSNACSTNGVANGQVSSTNPAAGTSQDPNTPVNLVVSSGPCAQVPSVVGQTQTQASSNITGAQLTPSVTMTTNCATSQNGTVTSQDPGGGTPGIAQGSTVTITVCNASTTTSTTGSTSSTSSSTTSTTS